MEYVIRGNAAVLKCSIPSFVADFVRVESWIDEEGTVLLPPTDNNYGVLYYTRIKALNMRARKSYTNLSLPLHVPNNSLSHYFVVLYEYIVYGCCIYSIDKFLYIKRRILPQF